MKYAVQKCIQDCSIKLLKSQSSFTCQYMEYMPLLKIKYVFHLFSFRTIFSFRMKEFSKNLKQILHNQISVKIKHQISKKQMHISLLRHIIYKQCRTEFQCFPTYLLVPLKKKINGVITDNTSSMVQTRVKKTTLHSNLLCFSYVYIILHIQLCCICMLYTIYSYTI